MFRAFLLAVFLTLSAIPFSTAKASYITGNILYDWCTSDTDTKYGWCQGYILGSVDTQNVIRSIDNKKDCIPDGVSSGQLKDIVVKYLQSRPEERHWDASALVWNAINSAFTCGP
jgi:hypothetical protein